MPILTKTGFSVHPVGVFRARLIEVSEVESLKPDWAPQFRFKFESEVKDETGDYLTVSCYVGRKLTDKSKLGQLVKALGFDVGQMKDGQQFNTDDLLNRTCRLVVEHQQRSDGTVTVRVTSVLPDDDDTGNGGGDTGNGGDQVPF